MKKFVVARTLPNYSEETRLRLDGFDLIAGVDEVGRGPLAGPVTAAAVILDPYKIPKGLNDSKKLSVKMREVVYTEIFGSSLVGMSHVSVEEINRTNILEASLLAMTRALSMLKPQPDFALIDGNKIPIGLSFPAKSLIKGDSKSSSIAAASIVAKISRDRFMKKLSVVNPGYGWEKNAGYPTKEHLFALRDIGVTPHHRLSFKPVHNILYSDYDSKK